MSLPDTDSQNASAAEHYALQFPYQRSVRIRRDLKHFDCWLRATFEMTIDAPLPMAFIYKVFFLSHIALYPSVVMRDCFLSEDLTRDLQQLGLMDADVLSCRQVFARILSVIRWQHYKFKTDTHKLMRELTPFYRQLCEVTRSPELTYKSTPQPENISKIFRREPVPGPQPERDSVILLMTWFQDCSSDELAQLSFDRVDAIGPLDWVYVRPNVEGTPVQLDHITALSILDLVGVNFDLMGYDPDALLNCRDGLAWRPLTESDIEVIVERHYRYAKSLWGFDHHIAPLLPAEEALYTDALKTMTEAIFANRRQSCADADEEEHACSDANANAVAHAYADEDEEDHVDWDTAVRKQAGRHRPAEHENGAYEDEQVDWDAAVMKSK